MAWKVFALLVTSVLALNAVLIVYNMSSRKTEYKSSNIFSGEEVDPHNKELTPALRQGLENRKSIENEDQIGLVI